MTDVREQIEALYRQHAPALIRYARRHTANESDAEDVLHETFVQASLHWRRLSAATLPRAWLFSVARNMAGAMRRRLRIRKWQAIGKEVPAAPGEPEDTRFTQLREAIGRLPAAQRETLELRLRDELSYAEIAGVLGVPIGTVRSRLHDAVRRLTEELRGLES